MPRVANDILYTSQMKILLIVKSYGFRREFMQPQGFEPGSEAWIEQKYAM